jgi:hypothetical protein
MANVLNAATNNKHVAEIEAALRGQKILTPADAKAWGLIDEEREKYFNPNAVIASLEPASNNGTPSTPPPLASDKK